MLQSQNLVGEYKLCEMLSEDGHGERWLAAKNRAGLRSTVALKLMELPVANEVWAVRLEQEAQSWLELEPHPNVVPLLDAAIHSVRGQKYLTFASEYIPGGSLQDWLENYEDRSPSWESVIPLMDGILCGLSFLHTSQAQPIIHGALNPASVLLRSKEPCLTDYGIAVIRPAMPCLWVSASLDYLAPEALAGEYSVATDIWSAGVLFYQLLTGDLPFRGRNIREQMRAIQWQDAEPLPGHIPVGIRNIVSRALQKEARQRFSSATEMRAALLKQMSETTGAQTTEVSQLLAELETLRVEVATLRRSVNRPPPFDPQPPDSDDTWPGSRKSPAPAADARPAIPMFTQPVNARMVVELKPKSRFNTGVRYAKAALLIILIGSLLAAIILGLRRGISEQDSASMTENTPQSQEATPTPVVEGTPRNTDSAAQSAQAMVNRKLSVVVQKIPGGELRLLPITDTDGRAMTKPVLYFGETEVTRKLWKSVAELPPVYIALEAEPWRVENANRNSREKVCDECPVEKVTWDEVQEFLARLNVLSDKFKFRLPTSAEWELACGDCHELAANIKESGATETKAVGQSGPANKFGLYDMYGNVWEWCQDTSPQDDERKVIRGSSWKRPNSWDSNEEEYKSYPDGGFRVVAISKDPTLERRKPGAKG